MLPTDGLLHAYTKVIDLVDKGAMWLTQDGRFLAVNEKLASDLGYQKADFENKTIFEVNPHFSLFQWKRFWKDLLTNKQIDQDTEHVNKDDILIPVRIKGQLTEIDGEPIFCAVVENKIETQKYEALLNMASRISKVAAWEWDIMVDRFTISDEMYRLLNIQKGNQFDRQNIDDFLKRVLLENEYKLLMEKLKKAIKEGESFELEIKVNTNNSHYKPLNLNVLPIASEDLFEGKYRTLKLYGTLQDLSTISGRTKEMYFTQFCIDNARDMIFWVEEGGKIIYANNSACKRLGYTSEELKEMNVTEFNKDLSKEKLEESIWAKLKERKHLEVNSIYKNKNGETFPVVISANHIVFDGQEFSCSFVRDVSVKKERDKLIELTHATLNETNDMIIWGKPDGSVAYFNDTVCRKLGYSRSEFEQLHTSEFLVDYSEEMLEKTWKRLRKQKNFQAESVYRTKSGELITAEKTMSYHNFDGEETSCSIIRDIRVRKAAESKLKNAFDEISELKDQLEAENTVLKEEIELEFSFDNIISRDPNYKKVLRQVEQVADTDATVLITGETGTGKELLARAIHQLSDRAEQNMIKINCGALPENLIESELFGHEKGAFTGAYQQKKGRFELANNGTLFLDEMGELPLDLQSKLLRVLQEGEFERVGGNKTISVDVRVIAATNRNLEKQVAKGKFRQDLYYRLNVFPIHNIPLRERLEDIEPLVRFFTDRFSQKFGKKIEQIPQSIFRKMTRYQFPGNVRELENMIERSVILTNGKVLKVDDALFSNLQAEDLTFKTMEEMQRDHILKALRKTKGKVSGSDGAASLLGMNDKTLSSRMKKLKIEKRDYLKK